jgi:hypothetical protein
MALKDASRSLPCVMELQGKKPDPYQHLSEDACAAMGAVEKAIKDLPPTEDLQMTVFEGDGGFGNKPPDEPPNRGSKVGASAAFGGR